MEVGGKAIHNIYSDVLTWLLVFAIFGVPAVVGIIVGRWCAIAGRREGTTSLQALGLFCLGAGALSLLSAIVIATWAIAFLRSWEFDPG